MIVVDLGAAPGGWSQVAADLIKPNGRVVAVDVLAMKALKGVAFIQGDMREEGTFHTMGDALGGKEVDVVMSDMAPNLSGIKAVDQSNMLALAGLALELAQRFLKPKGDFLIKMFQGEGLDPYIGRLAEFFQVVHRRKPRASRDRSSEVYIVGRSYRGRL
jgi:23S rRNA (uridine2552-2'-O)-methyltransferase